MQNLKVLTVMDDRTDRVEESIDLSDSFCDSIFLCIDYLSSSSSLSSLSFYRFEIVKPKTSINQFIKKYKNQFENKRWKLENKLFVRKERAIKGAQMLLIEKMPN